VRQREGKRAEHQDVLVLLAAVLQLLAQQRLASSETLAAPFSDHQ